MPAEVKVKSPLSAFQFFQIARYVSLLAASILITKSTLQQEFIGHYETYLLLATTISFFWVNGILTIFLRIYGTEQDKAAVIFNTFLILILVSGITSILLLIFHPQVDSLFRMSGDRNSFWIFIAYFFLNSIAFLAEYILLAKQQFRYLTALGIFHLLVQTAFIAAPVYLFSDYQNLLIGLTLFTALKFTITTILILQNGHFKVNYQILKNYKLNAPPLIIAYFLGGIAIYVDGIIVTHYFDKQTFAMYQYGAREFPLSLLLANALSATLIQGISSNKPEGLLHAKQSSERLMHMLFPVCIFLLLVSKWLFPAVFNPQFAESYIYFNIYLLLLIPRLVFPQSVLTALGYNKMIMISSAIEFSINIILSLLFLKWFGLAGVAIATVFAFITDKTILAIYLKKKLKIGPEHYTPIRTYFIYSFLLFVAFLLTMLFY